MMPLSEYQQKEFSTEYYHFNALIQRTSLFYHHYASMQVTNCKKSSVGGRVCVCMCGVGWGGGF